MTDQSIKDMIDEIKEALTKSHGESYRDVIKFKVISSIHTIGRDANLLGCLDKLEHALAM